MSTTTDNLVVDIVRTLEEHGLPRDEYQLANEFDPESLGRLIESGGDAVQIRLEIHGISLVVTNFGVRVVGDRFCECVLEPTECPHCGLPRY